MISIPARLLLWFYSAFLLFYFVPWNLRNIEKADLLEEELKLNYGQVNALDEMEITLTQLFSFVCVVISVLSSLKCLYMAFAPARFNSNVCLYPLAVFVSIAVSVLTHDTFPQSILYSTGSWSMLIQPLLAVSRGFLLYRVLFSAPRALVKVTNEQDLRKVPVQPQLTMFEKLIKLTANLWFLTYWCAYVVLGCFFYNEIVKYVVEEHIDLKTVMNFILV